MSASVAGKADSESPKRQAVLDAAERLFIAQGYGAVSMDAIARAANVSKATLYAHFASKDRLFATIITEACQANFDWRENLPDVALEPRVALVDLGRRVLRFLLQDRALAIHRVIMAESTRFPELGRAFYEGGPGTARQRFGAWLARETAAGRLRVADPVMAADQWMGLLRAGALFRALLGVPPPPSDAEIDANVDAAVDVFLAAYGCPEVSSSAAPSRRRDEPCGGPCTTP